MSMSRPPKQNAQSKTHRFLGGSTGRTDEANLPAPLQWIVELIQRLVAVMFIVIADAVKMVFSSEERPHGTGRHQMEVEAKRALGHHPDKPPEAKDLLPKRDQKND